LGHFEHFYPQKKIYSKLVCFLAAKLEYILAANQYVFLQQTSMFLAANQYVFGSKPVFLAANQYVFGKLVCFMQFLQ
jgi:hypothetical protein